MASLSQQAAMPARTRQEARRYMVLHFPRWATDCLKRHDADLASLKAPFALYERQANAMRLVACDETAEAAGLAPGLTLSDARALCPALAAREIDRGFIAAMFAEMADWHTNLAPIVSVLTDWGAYGDLGIDITGAAHLFGGESAMLELAQSRLAQLGLTVSGAIAPSVGAALALSHHAPGQVVEGGDALAEALAPLPVAALRLDAATVLALRDMGLKTIGQLYARDRGALVARFGDAPVIRLDQALGRGAERLVPRLPVPAYEAMRRFAEPVGLIDDVTMTVTDLAQTLAGRLADAGAGAQTFHLMLHRVDHRVMCLSVNAARATRDAGHIARLIANRIDRLTADFDAGFGIETIRLGAETLTDMDAVQTSAFGTADGTADLDCLVDRLASRLGPQAIMRSRPVDTHIPENAVALEPAATHRVADPRARPDPALTRPLRLLPAPEEITVMAEVPDGPPARMEWRHQTHRFVRASGPERIAVEWWQPGGDAFTRDYYVGETAEGMRFWLFREGLYTTETGTPRWFMHGVFA